MKRLLFIMICSLAALGQQVTGTNGSGSGGVTSVATTSPITGGTITTTGTIACASCVTYTTPATGIARSASGSQAIAGSELSGVVATSGSNVTTPGKSDVMQTSQYCSDAGASDTYACNLSPAITAYVTGTIYEFKANTANTGAASINFNSVGALTIKKLQGAITTDLADNDIRVGQWVRCIYDGTNCQMVSQLGNSPSASITGTDTQVLFFDGANNPAGDADFVWDKTNNILTVTSGYKIGAPSASCTTGLCFLEATAPSGIASYDILYPDSTAHRWKMSNNNGTAAQVVASGADINTSDQVTSTHITGGTNTDLAVFNATGNLVNYGGATSCTNQAMTGFSAAGASTCSTVTQGFVDSTVNGYSTAGVGAVNPAATTDTKLAEIQLGTAYLSVSGKAVDGHTHVVTITGTTQTPTYTLKVKACTVSGCGSGTALTLCTLGPTGAMTASNTVHAHFDFSILVTTTGASGVLETSCHGSLNITQLGTGGVWWQDINNAGSSTIDLTGTIYIDIVGQVSTQSGTKNSMNARLTTLKPVN